MFGTQRLPSSQFGRRAGSGPASRTRHRRPGRRLTVEALEGRALLSGPDYLIAATVTPAYTDPTYNGPVLLFGANGNDAPTPLSEIPGHPQTSLYDPRGAAFDPTTGELFIANREGGTGGSISRFFVDASGNYTPNGTITGNGLDLVSSVGFHDGELFATNYFAGTISRFKFDTQGAPIPDGTIAVGGIYLEGVAFSPSGELFASTYSTIYRYLIDPSTGAPIPNGTIDDSGPGRFVGDAFSPNGDLLVASLDDSRVLRFSFDAGGDALLDQSISVDRPIGVTISPSGELLVTTHGINPGEGDHIGKITGFLPDPDGNYEFNWSIPSDSNSDSLGGIAIWSTATTHLTVTAQPPTSVTAGSTFGLTVTAVDSSGNPDISFNGMVTVVLASNPGGATLGGTLTATANNGVATFPGLTLDKAATGYTLHVSTAGLLSATTSAFDVTPAAANQLVVTTQPPGNVGADNGFGLIVSAEDQFGNVSPSFGGRVAVALLDNPTGGTLGGTLTVTAQSGVATFSGLTLDQVGTGYTIQVSSRGLTGTTTSAFSVQTTVGSSVGVSWGTSGSATLQTGSDALRLLPAGRNTDLPWMGIQQLQIILSQAATLSAGDITVLGAARINGAAGINYGPVTLSGSGTSYTITLGQAISQADRVTLTLSSALIASFTRRLDVLPGDVNDDGVVSAQDVVLVRNAILKAGDPLMIGWVEVDGNGVIDMKDFTAIRSKLGSRLPKP